jgi:hypothetical protein
MQEKEQVDVCILGSGITECILAAFVHRLFFFSSTVTALFMVIAPSLVPESPLCMWTETRITAVLKPASPPRTSAHG